jgi:parallel beta-helix repeat protein
MNRFTLAGRRLALALGVLGALSAHASTYYVGMAGDDAATGLTPSAAWRTIQHAVDRVDPGDVIQVQTGTYVGARIERSGTAELPIELRGAAGAVLNAPGPTNAHQSILELETWQGTNTVAYWIVEGFEITKAQRYGIDVRRAHDILVRGNRVHHCGLTGIFTAFADGITVENNASFENGEHGLYFSNSGDRPEARGNQLYGNKACGVHLNGDVTAGGDGIISDGLIEKNTIYGNGATGGAGINMDGVVLTLVRNNLLYNNLGSGIALFKGNGAVPSSYNRILNNTVVMAPEGQWALVMSNASCTSNKVFNNILWCNHPARGSIAIATPKPEGFECDYNVVSHWFSVDNGGRHIDQFAWRPLGYDTHSVVATLDRIFADIYAFNFHLKRGGVAVDAGRRLQDVDEDIDSTPRPRRGHWLPPARWDIGAYELVR